MKKRIYFLNPHYDEFSIEHELLAGTPFEFVPIQVQPEDDKMVEQIADAVAVMTNEVPVSEAVAARLSKCKVITRTGVGFDIIDVPGCRKHGIEVCYVPDYGTEDVANHAIALLFAVHRRLLIYHRSVEEGNWDYKVAGAMHSLRELRLGVFGLGRIGSDFAGKMQLFVKEILGHDPYLSRTLLAEKGVRPSSPDEIFAECQLISLHIPHTPESHHFICDETINRMKQKPILINVSRGGVVDTQALVRALRTNQLSGAGLDVLETEPKVEADLVHLPNVVMSPHAAWFSIEASQRLRRTAMTDILRVLSGERPKYPVPASAAATAS